ncbi:MAG: hypothetical protein JO149_03080, partial [Gammaproteobacteria bacterium]|nr:hypothetical protein [Gammaproteobacteria bacterium]
MKILKKYANVPGFTDIFISNFNDEMLGELNNLLKSNLLTENMVPEKKPYIIFYLKINEHNFNKNFFTDQLCQLKYLGKVKHVKSNYFAITITGHRKVQEAIRIFKQKGEYVQHCERDPQCLKSYLDNMEAVCKAYKQNNPRKTPVRSKSINLFQHLDGKEIDIHNLNGYVNKKDPQKFQFNITLPIIEKKTGKQFLLKIHSGKRNLANFEVAHGLIERILLGECHPDVYLVHNEMGEGIGSISEMYPPGNFITIRKYVENNAAL